jgi:predicted O-methyltransferase YrrM
MNFTQDWFTQNIPNFEKCMLEIGEQRKNFLEIGSYEGRSTCWLMQNGLQREGTIICIDPYEGMPEIEKRFWENTREANTQKQMVSLFNAKSRRVLSELTIQKQEFDFIYIDGDHDPATTLTDACMAWGLLRQGGVMLFDDYEYPHEPTKNGILGFMQGFADKYELVLQNYQLAVRKK